MVKWYIIAISMSVSCLSLASEHHTINTLGSSKKGQFVALEEYGYRPHNNSFFVKINVMNVWKEEYVGRPVEVEMFAHPSKAGVLQQARERAKLLAKDELLKFQISSQFLHN